MEKLVFFVLFSMHTPVLLCADKWDFDLESVQALGLLPHLSDEILEAEYQAIIGGHSLRDSALSMDVGSETGIPSGIEVVAPLSSGKKRSPQTRARRVSQRPYSPALSDIAESEEKSEVSLTRKEKNRLRAQLRRNEMKAKEETEEDRLLALDVRNAELKALLAELRNIRKLLETVPAKK